jgi:hypothetical protein
MTRLMLNLWRREDGASTGLEWLLVAEVMALGSIVALLAIRRVMLGN